MPEHFAIITYDFTDAEDRKTTLGQIRDYCGDPCMLSESCYMIRTSDSKTEIFESLAELVNEANERLSVIIVDDIKSSLACGVRASLQVWLDKHQV